MRNLYKGKIFILFFSVLLIVVGILASIVFNSYSSFSVLTVRENPSNLKFTHTSKLLKGDKLTGEFVGKENNLGIVYIKFNNYVKPDYLDEDTLIFKIKEKGAKSWYLTNKYKSGILEDNLFFPFGFSQVPESKGRTFVFELQSLKGNNINSVEIDLNGFAFASGYQVPKNQILASKQNLVNFIIKKILYSYENIDFVLYSILYFLPAFFYIFWNTFLNKFIAHKYLLATITLFLVIVDLVFVKEVYSGIIFGILGLWAISIFIYKLGEDISLTVSLVLIILSVFLIQMRIHSPFLLNKLSVWAYFLLLVGIIEKIVYFNKKSKNISVIDFIRGHFKFL